MKTKSKTNWKLLDALRDNEINFSEIPRLGPSDLARMALRLPLPKVPVSIRLDQDTLAWFKRQGEGYQTRMNEALKAFATDPANAVHTASVREVPSHYASQKSEVPARVLEPTEIPIQPLRFTIRDDNARHYHRKLKLDPAPVHIRIFWRATRSSAVFELGVCRLDLPRLLEAHLVRPEPTSPGYVRVRFWRNDEGKILLRSNMQGPGISLFTLPKETRAIWQNQTS